MVSAGTSHTVFLLSDGSAVAIGLNEQGECDIPLLPDGVTYTKVSAGFDHTVLLRSDGCAVAIGCNISGQCDLPALDDGMTYIDISAGFAYTVLLRSDGSSVAVGSSSCGQCSIPLLPDGVTYTQISAGSDHAVLLRSDGSAVATGGNVFGECNIPLPEPGIRYIGDTTQFATLVLQLELLCEEDRVTLIGSTAGGEERCHLIAQGNDSAWESHKTIARGMNVDLQNLRLILPDRQLLAEVCRTNPGASLARVAQIIEASSAKRQRVSLRILV